MTRLVPFALLVCAADASAYLDPGSGSLLFASIFGLFATAFFVLRSTVHRLLGLRGRGRRSREAAHGIVCYAEGGEYWSTFRPLVAALNRLGHGVTYLTSDPADPALMHARDDFDVRYIGRGSRAHAYLNFLEAAVCISTTPGLDVLQIKRSPGVDRYVHVVHSAMDVHTYKLFSFDYFDAVLCAGQHQVDSLRALERKRGTAAKTLALAGCLYYDEQVAMRDASPPAEPGPTAGVLVAPTWGRNGLLTRCGERLLATLLDAGLAVTVRPHPQSRSTEPQLLDALARRFDGHPNLRWDHEPDGFSSMRRASVMVSDISGAMFDFAFVFGRPVISIDYTPDWLGTEAFDLDTKALELTVLDSIGRRIAPHELPKLPGVIAELDTVGARGVDIASTRARMAVNFGQAGAVAAELVLALAELDQPAGVGAGSSR